MIRVHFWGLWLTLLWLLSVALSGYAQSGGGFELIWSTVDGGGVTFSAGGGYTLGGTIGQGDAGALQGGNYRLAGGFWGSWMTNSAIYLPLTLR